MDSMQTWTGTVRALDHMFRTAPDGTVRFEPINDYYGAFHLTEQLSELDLNACTLTLEDGEYFQVLEDTNKSDGYGPRAAAGNYLHYLDAYRAAWGKGVQGGMGEITIKSPAPDRQITALDHDGREVVVGIEKAWRSTRLAPRLVFPNRAPKAT